MSHLVVSKKVEPLCDYLWTLLLSVLELLFLFSSTWLNEISTFHSAVLDFGKYFFRNFSTIYSHVHRLFPLNEWSHLFASLAKEKENRLRWMASSGTPTSFTVLQVSMYVARCAYVWIFTRQTMKYIPLN